MQIIVISDNEYIYNQLIREYTQLRHYSRLDMFLQQKNVDEENILIIDKTHAIELIYNDNITEFNKPFRLYKLINALEYYIAIINHKKIIELLPEVILDVTTSQLMIDGQAVKLTDKETHILSILSEKQDQVLSKGYLLEKIWGYNEATETHTIETHIYNLRQKLGDYAFLLKTEGEGYILGY